MLAVVAVVGVIVGVLVRDILRKYGAKVDGQVIAEGTRDGSRSFGVTHCFAGRVPGSGVVGVDLRGEHGPGLRANGSGEAAELYLFPGAYAGFDPIRRAACSEWDVLVEPAVTTAGDRSARGHVHVTCRARGGKVAAHVTFDGCAF